MSNESGNQQHNVQKSTSFWTTLPGVLTATATLVGSIGGIIVALHNGADSKADANPDAGEKAALTTEAAVEAATTEREIDPTTMSPQQLLEVATTEWAVVASDDFSRNISNWREGEALDFEERGTASINVNGKYLFDASTQKGGIFPPQRSNITLPKTPFHMQIDMKRISQAEGCFSALNWDVSPDGSYSFRVDDADKEYKIGHRSTTGKYSATLKESTNLIKSGASNRLSIISSDGMLYLFINDTFIKQIAEEYPAKGNISLQFGVCDNNTQTTFEADNLEVRAPG